MKAPAFERLILQLDWSLAEGCWRWRGPVAAGYGQLSFRGRKELAHRVSWIHAYGEIPEATPCVLHHCDEPLCWRPTHLFLGTRADNSADMVRKGRVSRQYGNTNGAGRLAPQVETIRARYAAGGISQAALARELGLHQTTVNQIITGRRWATA